jgi:hypothetical protein
MFITVLVPVISITCLITFSCHEILRSNSRILQLAEASEEGQGPRRAVEPMMMMMRRRRRIIMCNNCITFTICHSVSSDISAVLILLIYTFHQVTVASISAIMLKQKLEE